MICEHCGTECVGSVPACKYDALKTQLASMTKRAEDAEREKTELLDTILTPEDYAKSSQDLWAQAVQADKERDAAEAKLATAVEFITELSKQPYLDRYAVRFADTLRALGIDPTSGS